jgi:RNA polymerase sigma factor (TIGR02999 family)
MLEASDVTGLLLAWSDGQPSAGPQLIEAVYGELRRLARGYLQLVDQRRVRWQNRVHFFAVAAHVMRRILVDHARARGAAKRGNATPVTLTEVGARFDPPDVDILALDIALEKLARIDPRQGQLVELRFFGGLTVDEIATVLDVAPITVKRDWQMARTWLYRELQGGTG